MKDLTITLNNLISQEVYMKQCSLSLILSGILIILSVPLVSAHEGESASGPTNFQIMLISIVISTSIYFFISKFLDTQTYLPNSLIFALASFTGSVHIFLGLNDYLLLIGGVGVIGILVLSLIVNFNQWQEKIARLGLGLGVTIMFVAYFVSNHDIHYIIEDYLGITTKLAELMIIIFLSKEWYQKRAIQ